MRPLIACLSLVMLTSAAFACSCASFGGCPGLHDTLGPVFLGTVLAVTDLPRTGADTFLSFRKARFHVDELLGGLSADVHEIDVLTGLGGGDCGVPFQVGEVYLVDAVAGKDGLVHASICSSTRRIDAAGTLLRILRDRRDGRQLPSLAGQIAQRDRNFDGLLGTYPAKPLANALVRVKADGQVFEARADSDGLYEFHNLPTGRYEFVPELPQGATVSWYIGSDEPLPPVQLTAGACQVHNIEVFASGTIQGRILDSSNTPLADAFVYIVPVDQQPLTSKRQLYWASQGKEGFYEFVHIPQGQYLVLVNPEDSLSPDFPYRRTFYPGVHDRASATVIAVHAGEQIRDADIRLEQQFLPRRFTVRVTWADGSLIKGFVHIEAKGTANPKALSDIRQPDLKASVIELSVLPNEPYEVEAELICRYADERSNAPGAALKSNRINLVPGDGRAELTLTIPATACPEIPGKTLVTDW